MCVFIYMDRYDISGWCLWYNGYNIDNVYGSKSISQLNKSKVAVHTTLSMIYGRIYLSWDAPFYHGYKGC